MDQPRRQHFPRRSSRAPQAPRGVAAARAPKVEPRELSAGADHVLDRRAWWRRATKPFDAVGAIDRFITSAILAGVALMMWGVILWCVWKLAAKLFR